MIDTHNHIYLSEYDADRDRVIERAAEAGVTTLLCPAIGSENHAALIKTCRDLPDVCLPMMGVHPTVVNDNPDWAGELKIVEKYLAEPPVERFYAIGEVGLDLHWSRDSLAEQTVVFERQIDLALQYGLPLAIHTRDAWPEMLAVLEKYCDAGLRGVLHAFSGSIDDYRRVRAVGDFVFGIGGPVTYKNSPWRELLPLMSPESLVLETDAPWLSPVPHRGSRNEPAYLTHILHSAAGFMGITPRELDLVTTANTRRVFDI